MSHELEEQRAWLGEHGVTHVDMESAGAYWRPVYAILKNSTSASTKG
jgi:hypothetical protein